MERGGGFPEPRGRGHLKYQDRKGCEKFPSISNLPVSPIGQTQLSVSDRLSAPWCREVGGMQLRSFRPGLFI